MRVSRPACSRIVPWRFALIEIADDEKGVYQDQVKGSLRPLLDRCMGRSGPLNFRLFSVSGAKSRRRSNFFDGDSLRRSFAGHSCPWAFQASVRIGCANYLEFN